MEIYLLDLKFPKKLNPRVKLIIGKIKDTKIIDNLIPKRFDIIFHLLAIESGEAEQNFENGKSKSIKTLVFIIINQDRAFKKL